MKATSKKLENCEVELKVTVEAEEMAEIIKNVEKTFLREAQIPGFRKGKAPMAMVRKEFAKGLKEETERALFQKNFYSAVAEEKLDFLRLSDVKDVVATAEGGSFTAIVEVKPEFKLPTYKGLKIEFRDTTMSDEELNKQFEDMRAAYATFEEPKEDSVVQEGDFVQIDYSGTVGGKSILEVAPDATFVAGREGFWFQVLEGRFLPELIEAVKGMKIGETKEGVKAKFDKEVAPEGLKGEKALYTITVKSLRSRVMPNDEQLCEKMKLDSIEKIKEDIRERWTKNAVESETIRRENEAFELLLKKVDFAIPQSQVNNAIQYFLSEFIERAKYSGITPEYVKENQEALVAEAKEAAEKQVRVSYLIDAIAAAEDIKAEGDKENLGKKVAEFLVANAKK